MSERAPDTGPARRFDPLRHRLAVLLACATVVLLAAGGLVTSTGSGLAVPDWPLSFGRFFPRMVGGVLYEHGHRIAAAAVGAFTLILAGWFLLREGRRWVRMLALFAAGAIVAQGLLGGLTVLLRLPPSVSVAHACLAQGFFCLTIVLALATSRGFIARTPSALEAEGSPPLWALASAACLLIYGQLILGAIMRHTGAGLAIPDFPLSFGRIVPPFLSFEIAVHFAHRVGALFVATAVLLAAARVMKKHRERGDLVVPSVVALVLLAVQIALGAATVLTRLAVAPATAHVVTGALLLAACLVLAVRSALGWTPATARIT
ncbi:MAG: heme A synthase, partial [Chloroflexi bacterium]